MTATVTSGLGVVPDGYVFSLGSGASGTFTVTAGQIAYANAYFLKDSNYLFLGTDPFGTTYYPEIFSAITGADVVSLTAPTFSPVRTAAVPEPATWAMVIVGFCMVGGAARRRRRTTIVYA